MGTKRENKTECWNHDSPVSVGERRTDLRNNSKSKSKKFENLLRCSRKSVTKLDLIPPFSLSHTINFPDDHTLRNPDDHYLFSVLSLPLIHRTKQPISPVPAQMKGLHLIDTQ